MKLSKNLRKLLMDEMNLIVDKIEKAKSPDEVMYYFSAVGGLIQRIFNFEFHAELVHLWVILNPLFQTLNQKFSVPAPQYDNSNSAQLHRIVELTKNLKEAFDKNEDISRIIEGFAVLLYSANGNGTYLYQKGMIKLED